jgi:type II secretory pathway component GspD/PulD (secretin)
MFLLGLAVVPSAFSQPPERGRGSGVGGAVDLPALVRRVAELEKQVETLNKEVESLRTAAINKEVDALRKDGKTRTASSSSSAASPTASSSGSAAAPAPEVKTQMQIYILRDAEATEVAKTLAELFRGEESKKLRIAPNKSTNSIVVRGRAEDLEEIQAIVTRLELAATDVKKAREARGDAKGDVKQ